MWQWVFVGVLLVVMLMLLVGGAAWSGSRGQRKRSHSRHGDGTDDAVYGEFINPFSLGASGTIVPAGGSLAFPIPTVEPMGVAYVEQENRVGLLVPHGTYLASWTLNPSTGAAVDLLVNGKSPQSASTPFQYAYAQAVATGTINFEYLVTAPLKEDNLISLVNAGATAFTLAPIPNTSVDGTAITTHIRVQRLAP